MGRSLGCEEVWTVEPKLKAEGLIQTPFPKTPCAHILGGSWVVINGTISPLIWVITTITLLITPLIAAHDPLSRGSGDRVLGFGKQTRKWRTACWHGL